ncbi:MAG TPA: septal ring lytic transglycosylase RlpA family protein [Acidobacteriaceae bacterium]|nr:septal ring lytic transglycosylase RlpA family protein [Acidobacteriaceae bacterium]
MRRRPFTVAALALLVTVAGVASQAVADAPVHQEHPARSGKWYQIGKASWYGRRFQGHRTASGEAFDLNMLTCAHRTLPIGSLVRVTNLTNKRSIMVRVNDRGPIPNSKIVDLSWAAARSLGFSKMGSARVRLERVEGAEAALLNWPNLGRPGDDRQAFR